MQIQNLAAGVTMRRITCAVSLLLVIGTREPHGQHRGRLRLKREIGKHVRHKGLVDELFLERDAVSRVVDRLGNRLPHKQRTNLCSNRVACSYPFL